MRRIFTVFLLIICPFLLISCEAPKSDEQIVQELAGKYLQAVKEGNVALAQKYLVAEESQSVKFTAEVFIADIPNDYVVWEYEISKVELEGDNGKVFYNLKTKGKVSSDRGPTERMVEEVLLVTKEDSTWKITQMEETKGE